MRKAAYFFVVMISVVTVLIYGKELLVPFLFALLLWFVIREIRSVLNRVTFIRNRFPRWLKNLLTSVVIISILTLFAQMLSSNIKTVSASYPQYKHNAELLLDDLEETVDFDLRKFSYDHAGDVDFESILSAIFTSLTDLFGNTLAILFYALFFFLEETSFTSKLKAIYKSNEEYERVLGILNHIESAITRYMGLKTLASFMASFGAFVALNLIGVEAPLLWAVIIFVVYFIPNVGFVVGTILPALFGMIQFGDFATGILIFAVTGGLMLLVENVIEPRLTGSTLNLSSLTTVVVLSFWGALWGITGMILCIPITVVMMIVFAQFEKTKSIAILMSEKGEV